MGQDSGDSRPIAGSDGSKPPPQSGHRLVAVR
jgi:hypothetical protein